MDVFGYWQGGGNVVGDGLVGAVGKMACGA